MVRIALAPCSPFSVTPELMVRTAELAERLDVRLHTHLAEDPDEDTFAAERSAGARSSTSRTSAGDRPRLGGPLHLPERAEVARLGAAGRRRRPLPELEHDDRRRRDRAGGRDLRAAGVPVGLGCDGSSSTDSASLWMEARNAMLLGRLRGGPASTGAWTCWSSRPVAAPGASAAPASSVSSPWARSAISSCGRSPAIAFAGAITDPVEAWLRCGPSAAKHTVVAGRAIVRDGALVDPRVDEMLAWHRRVAARFQSP